MLTLYLHHEASPFVRKVLLVADALGLKLDEQRVDMTSQSAMLRYAQLNPTRKFPLLRDGEFILRESNAILEYLSGIADGRLHGTDVQERAQVRQWLYWELAHWGPAAVGLTNVKLGYVKATPQEREQKEQAFRQVCAILESALLQRLFPVGASPTIADYALAADLSFADDARLDWADFPNTHGWFERMKSTGSWKVTEERKRAALNESGH